MKYISSIFILIFFNSFLLQAQSREEQVKEVLTMQQNAWNKGDLNGFMEHYWKSDSLQFVSKNGVKYGWQKVYDSYQKNYADKGEMGVLDFGVLSIKFIGKNDCMLTGTWKVKNNSGTIGGYFTLWFKRINEQWLIVSDHTS